MKNKWQRIALILALLSVLSCAPRKKVPFTPEQIAEFNSKIKEAQALLNRGSYSSLERAFNIFEELLDFPPYQKSARENLVKTAILLCLRENEIGVINDEYFTAAAGYFNSGMMEKALDQAQKASLHKALQQRAQELIERIKKDKKLKGNQRKPLKPASKKNIYICKVILQKKIPTVVISI